MLAKCSVITQVDVLEFFTFYALDNYLAGNIFLSVIGSTLYILGSIGFLPALNGPDDSTSLLGIWGFILGSFFIGYANTLFPTLILTVPLKFGRY